MDHVDLPFLRQSDWQSTLLSVLHVEVQQKFLWKFRLFQLSEEESLLFLLAQLGGVSRVFVFVQEDVFTVWCCYFAEGKVLKTVQHLLLSVNGESQNNACSYLPWYILIQTYHLVHSFLLVLALVLKEWVSVPMMCIVSTFAHFGGIYSTIPVWLESTE